jgi:hypothetical protein
VTGVDDKVAGVDDRVAHVDERVTAVDERVAGVDEYVRAIDDKVAVVIDGAQPSLISHKIYSSLACLEGKETREVIQQVADDMDQVKS